MKTDDLVGMLARGLEPVPRHAVRDRLLAALAVALPFSVLIVSLRFGLRHDLLAALGQPVLWLKFGVPLVVALAAGLSLRRLASPGAPLGPGWRFGVTAVLALWALAAAQWAGLSEPARAEALWGSSWRQCPFNIAVVSLPLLAAVMATVRRLGVLRPVPVGLAAGMLAGALGAVAYALHCPESGVAFLAVWYVLGIAMVGAVGGLLGPLVFRG